MAWVLGYYGQIEEEWEEEEDLIQGGTGVNAEVEVYNNQDLRNEKQQEFK